MAYIDEPETHSGELATIQSPERPPKMYRLCPTSAAVCPTLGLGISSSALTVRPLAGLEVILG